MERDRQNLIEEFHANRDVNAMECMGHLLHSTSPICHRILNLSTSFAFLYTSIQLFILGKIWMLNLFTAEKKYTVC